MRKRHPETELRHDKPTVGSVGYRAYYDPSDGRAWVKKLRLERISRGWHDWVELGDDGPGKVFRENGYHTVYLTPWAALEGLTRTIEYVGSFAKEHHKKQLRKHAQAARDLMELIQAV